MYNFKPKNLTTLGYYAHFGGLLGSLQFLLRPGIEPGPHWPEANALTTTL